MKRIGLLSDTHGLFDQALFDFFEGVDEIWHAGDIGSIELADRIAGFRPLVGVYGNIDGGVTRVAFPRWQKIEREGVSALMTHVGGYPGRYERGVNEELILHRPKIFISGHSHILKVIYDKRYDLLHINPGAAGIHGFHNVRTAVRFIIDGKSVESIEVGEWPKRILQ